MSTLHLISDDLDEAAVPSWAAAAVEDMERLLATHAAFDEYLAGQDPQV